jgi:uncharacterized membrane protein HdeD (DUF308 family)
MGNAEGDNHKNGHHGVSFWIALVRGVLIVGLGLSLILIPEKTKAVLFNMMGVFWLTTGIVLIRGEMRRQGSRLSLAAGILGVLAGLLVVTRNITRHYLAEFWVMNLLGAVILLTGVLHVTTGLRVGRHALRGRTVLSTLLGVFEIVLGAGLLLTPITSQGQPVPKAIYLVAAIWALLGGGLILGTALFQGAQARRQEAGETQAVQAQPQGAGGSQPENEPGDGSPNTQPPSPST